MRPIVRALPFLLVLGCPSAGPSSNGRTAADGGKAAGKAPADERTAAMPEDASPSPAPDASAPLDRARALLALDGPTVSAKIPWRDENRIRLMSRLATIPAGTADAMIASLSAVDNDGVAEAFREQFAERWHDMSGCTASEHSGSGSGRPGPEVLAKLPAEFGAIATRLESATFVEIRCDADGRTFLLGLDSEGIVSARDTTPKDAADAGG